MWYLLASAGVETVSPVLLRVVFIKINMLLFASVLFFLLLQCAIALAYPFPKRNRWIHLNKNFSIQLRFHIKWLVSPRLVTCSPWCCYWTNPSTLSAPSLRSRLRSTRRSQSERDRRDIAVRDELRGHCLLAQTQFYSWFYRSVLWSDLSLLLKMTALLSNELAVSSFPSTT
ncbi:hypothetical protein GQ600_17795 [Phytophthora cactorum]|nr:hypothetical protein GQ600_17795 [Phytophthora cactorum]